MGTFQPLLENKRKKSFAWEYIQCTPACTYMTGMGRLKIRDGNLGNFLQLMDPTFWSPRKPIGRSSVLPDNACHLSEFVKRAFGPGFPESCWCCCYGKREYTPEGVNVAARRALSSLVCTHRLEASFIQTQLLFSFER